MELEAVKTPPPMETTTVYLIDSTSTSFSGGDSLFEEESFLELEAEGESATTTDAYLGIAVLFFLGSLLILAFTLLNRVIKQSR